MVNLYAWFDNVVVERVRQDVKWGEQNHDPITWSAILTEEIGEVAKAALEHRFGSGSISDVRAEAIQVAAVALALVECIDRNFPADEVAGGGAQRNDSRWWCETCKQHVQPEHVTFNETHDTRAGGCGNPVA